jgi:predicted outer membrane repeat protein
MKRKFARFAMIVMSALVLAALGTPPAAHAADGPLCYVDVDATGDSNGNSWEHAYTSLQYALNDANCTEIWVAEGIYKPGVDPSDKFMIQAGEQVYGGFAGTETSLGQRDWNTHLTILSGDIDNDDAIDFYGITESWTYIAGDNSSNIVWVDGITSHVMSSTRLDGFTITGGESNVPAVNNFGGGLYCNGLNSGHVCSPTLEHLRFYGNYATDAGGAIYNDGRGGGESSPTLQHVTFSGNHAADGGALFNSSEGGTTETTIRYAFFSFNSATNGGAIFTNGSYTVSTSVQIEYSLFEQNTASSEGGAIYNSGYNGNCFTGINSVTFYQNTATQYGGAIFNDGQMGGLCSPGITSSTFSGNSANYGGGIYNVGTDGTSATSLRSILMWGDTAAIGGPEIANFNAYPGIAYSDIQGSGGSGAGWDSSLGADIGFNIDSNPLLSGLADNGGETETMALLWGSPAIDTGEDGSCVTNDQRGVYRPQGNHCDMGALERVFPKVRADFESDGISDIGYWRPSTGVWAILESSKGFSYAAPRYYNWGASTDIITTGDFDGDGRWDPAFRTPPAGGQSAAYRILLSTKDYDFSASATVPAGWPTGLGDTPVIGDYNGDGKSDPAIWRGNTGVWIIPLSPSFTTHAFYSWGQSGDTPIAADVDGDLQTDIGYWRPSTGVWGFLQSSMGYSYGSPAFFNWGTAGNTPVIADYDGDSLADPAVVIPPAGGQSKAYRILLSTLAYDPAQSVTVPAGWPGLNDTPVPADYDGDGSADAGIWRGNTGVWIIPKSSTGNTSYMFAAWGAAGDVPAR